MRTIQKDIVSNDKGLILQGTNCQGVMGSGVAAAIRKAWPIVYEEFSKNGTGPDMLGTFQPVKINEELVVGNCYTQEFFGNDGKKYASLDAIETSFEKACQYAKDQNLSIKTPFIGCGLGGLNVSEVVPIFQELSEKYDVDVEINYI